MMKLIIAGGRDITNHLYLGNALRDYNINLTYGSDDEIVCGKARGVDSLGEDLANLLCIKLKEFPADWDKLGNAAGPARNEEMAKYATDLLLIWNGTSKGSRNMLENAKKHNLNIMQYYTEPIITSGDLFERFDNEEDWTLVHGCNCRTTMGAGIAKIIKDKYPSSYKEDQEFESSFETDSISKLGKFSQVDLSKNRTIINAYTQYQTGKNASYEAVRSCFRNIFRELPANKFILPAIGSGIGGLEFNKVVQIIREEMNGNRVLIYKPR